MTGTYIDCYTLHHCSCVKNDRNDIAVYLGELPKKTMQVTLAHHHQVLEP